jgi:hypothetical protein
LSKGSHFSSQSLQYSLAEIWLGNKWFKSFLAMWVVKELPPGTPLTEIKVSRILEDPVGAKALLTPVSITEKISKGKRERDFVQ